MPPVTLIATLRSLNGKPNDPGAAPLADLSLRCEATPELLNLFSGIGQEFDVTFVRRGGEQMEMFTTEGVDNFDFEGDEEPSDDEDLVVTTNGTAEPEPVAARGRRR